MGRPRKPDKRTHQINIKLTPTEFQTVGARASALGLAPAEYGRSVLLGETDHIIAKAPELSRFDRLAILQLQKLGALLNQLIRHLHRTHELLPEVEGLLREIRLLVNGCRL